jgi:hypothetical protein
MKKLVFTISIALLLITTVTTESCYPDRDLDTVIRRDSVFVSIKFDTTWEDIKKIDSFPSSVKLPFERLDSTLRPVLKTGFCDGEKGGKIEDIDDVEIDIPENAFGLPAINTGTIDNMTPVKGKVDITYNVLRSKGDIVQQGFPTMSGNRLLVSDGIINVRAHQNGKEVFLRKGKTYTIRFKSRVGTNGVQLFYGLSISRLKFEWVVQWMDSTREPKGYTLVLDRLGLINCARFYDSNEPVTANFCVAFADNSFTNLNTSVYLVFKDVFSVVRLEGSSTRKMFCIPTGSRGIPAGRNVQVVAISEQKGEYLMSIESASITEGGIVKLRPQVYKLDEIRNKLKSL